VRIRNRYRGLGKDNVENLLGISIRGSSLSLKNSFDGPYEETLEVFMFSETVIKKYPPVRKGGEGGAGAGARKC